MNRLLPVEGVVGPRPRVFISSTIRDFRDLRSALRHWLESAGYDVQLSEYNDFDRRPEDDTFETCFANVGTCDYYILLLGAERGSWYHENDRITVTRQEFRVARDRATEGATRIIAFVRADVQKALEQWNADGRPGNVPSRFLVDPHFAEDFLREIAAPPVPAPNAGWRWVYPFNDFRDIVDALRPVLRLDVNLAEKMLRQNLLNELLCNLTKLVTKHEGGIAFPRNWWADGARKAIHVSPSDLSGQIWLSAEQLGKIGIIGAVISPLFSLERVAIRAAMRAGVFLEVDPISGEFSETEAHRALALLEADVGEVLRTVGSERLTQAAEKLWQLGWQANRHLLTGANVDAAELVQILRAHDVVDDVFKGLAAFASYLIDVTLSPSIVRNPSSPIEGMSEKVEAEQFGPFELKSLLERRVYPFGPRLNSYLRDLLLGADDLVPRIRSLLPGEVASSLTDDEVRDIATRALSQDGAD